MPNQRPAAMHAVVVLVDQGGHADRSTLEKRKNGKVERGSRGRERWLTRLGGIEQEVNAPLLKVLGKPDFHKVTYTHLNGGSIP